MSLPGQRARRAAITWPSAAPAAAPTRSRQLPPDSARLRAHKRVPGQRCSSTYRWVIGITSLHFGHFNVSPVRSFNLTVTNSVQAGHVTFCFDSSTCSNRPFLGLIGLMRITHFLLVHELRYSGTMPIEILRDCASSVYGRRMFSALILIRLCLPILYPLL